MSQPSPLSIAQHQAHLQRTAGDLFAAARTLADAVAHGQERYGEGDPAVLAAAHQLAGVHRQAGDPSAARRVLEEAYAAGQRRLAESDPLLLAISFDLGVVADELGNRHKARRAFSRVATMGPAVLGEDHWAVRQSRVYLGEDPPTVRLTVDQPAAEAAQPTASTMPMPQLEPTLAGRAAPGVPRPRSDPEATGHAAPAVVAPRPAPEATPQPAAGPVAGAPTQPSFGGLPPLDAPRFPAAAGQNVDVAFRDGGVAYRVLGFRGAAVFAAVAAGLATVIAAVALVVVLASSGDRPAPTATVPNVGGKPPMDVRLRDLGETIEVSWRDPTNGTVAFFVTGGHPGELLTTMGRLGPGQTSLRLHGLNRRLDYCFAVVAAYPDALSPSAHACTRRGSPPGAK